MFNKNLDRFPTQVTDEKPARCIIITTSYYSGCPMLELLKLLDFSNTTDTPDCTTVAKMWINQTNSQELSKNYWRAYVSLKGLSESYCNLNDMPVLCYNYQ